MVLVLVLIYNVGDANDVGDIVINDLRIEGIYITVLAADTISI